MNRLAISLFACALAALLYGLPAKSLASDIGFSDAQESAIRSIVREYLLEHPEVLEEAISVLQARRQAGLIGHYEEALNDPTDAFIGGNPKGDVTVIEFFDYRCGYCKSVRESLVRLRAEDKNVRFVYRELPVLGPQSEAAARAAIASRKQNKYPEFHEALMASRGSFSDEMIMAVAKRTGLDVAKLREDMKDPSIDGTIERTRRLAEALDITGTPGFIFGSAIVPGAIAYEDMKAYVARARAEAEKAEN